MHTQWRGCLRHHQSKQRRTGSSKPNSRRIDRLKLPAPSIHSRRGAISQTKYRQLTGSRDKHVISAVRAMNDRSRQISMFSFRVTLRVVDVEGTGQQNWRQAAAAAAATTAAADSDISMELLTNTALTVAFASSADWRTLSYLLCMIVYALFQPFPEDTNTNKDGSRIH